ncbi:AAA family ATPase [Loktanella sp. 3ANDIMAR09]|uniref:AAA family ATPase n=1 Tax=Loktanella sp. 3ANDIMAR09 TaxID=1225657 RepID=UPI0007002C8E|nr:ATP-binding protein [Loktanella sp. 3ANDIMAR09]KQI68298.1 AAA family ATPase [Loktanella sp. 3ANDIMAR09]
MSQTSDQMELRESDIRAQYGAALALLDGFDHAPRLAQAAAVAAPERSAGIGTRRAFRSTTPGLVTRRTTPAGAVSLQDRIGAVGDDALTTPLQAQVLQALRRALAIAIAVGDQLADRTGLTALKAANLGGTLPADRRADFTAALAAEALAVLFTFGSATAHLLADRAGGETVDLSQIDELLVENAPLALNGVLWELDRDIAALATSDATLVATVLAFADALQDQVTARAGSATGLEAFRAASWHVAADDFTLRGFTPARARRSTTLTMAFKKPDEVIGNHIAKAQAMRLAKMLMAYDFDRRLNPFAELGGFIFTFMGDGAPGTGKTTLIQMMAGLIAGYCETAGYAFRYQNLSTENIDSYQGKSGQNAKAFVDNILDPNVIGFGTIDDIDQLAGKRGDRQSSAGQLEITAVLMDAFAGAGTVVRGNCTFGMFSNFPENVDDALRQRAGARFLVDGPQTQDDYIDILHLLLGKKHDIPLGDHDLYAAQAIQRAVAASYASHARPKEAALEEVFDRVQDRIGALDTIAKLGTYLKAIQEADARFTGRAIKNITDAVKVRAMDFELPDDWMEDPDLFLFQDYDTKMGMISELRKPITPETVLQEINRYADSEFRYADKSDAVAIDTAVREMERMAEARRRFAAGGAA